jgi:ABC-type transporter Mla subunit MlaD
VSATGKRGERPTRRPAAIAQWARGHRTLLGLCCAAGGLLLAAVAWSSVNGVPLQDRYTLNAVIPKSAPILKEGDGVRIAGRLAGLVTGIEPGEDGVHVEVELEPGFAPVGEDARSYVRVKSIIYLTYLEIVPGDVSNPMPEGGTIEVARSGSGVDLLEVVELFDRRTREALGRSTYATGTGVAGRGSDLNAALQDLPPTLRDATGELQALTAEPGALGRSIEGAAGVTAGLGGERPDDLGGAIASGAAVTETLASRADALRSSLDLLAPFEAEVIATGPPAREFLGEAEVLARELEPPFAELAAVLDDVNATLAMGDELREQTERLTASINPALIEAAPVLAALEPTVASVDPLLVSLDELIETVEPYSRDITLASEGLISSTSGSYEEGATAPGASALRFVPVLTCHRARNPYPRPGETLGQAQEC